MDRNLDNFDSPIEKAEMLTVLSVGFLVLGNGSPEPRSRQKSADFFMGDDLKGKKPKAFQTS